MTRGFTNGIDTAASLSAFLHPNQGEERRDEDVSSYQELLAWLTIYRQAGLRDKLGELIVQE